MNKIITTHVKYREKRIYMLCGQFGVGKTTLSKALVDKFTIIEVDKCKGKKGLHKAITSNLYNDKPVLIDIPTMIITVYNAYKDLGYTVIPIFLIEDISVVKKRILSRKGLITKSIESRYKRIVGLSKRISTFSGTYDQVFNYLIKLQI